jgi:hypothetical protein
VWAQSVWAQPGDSGVVTDGQNDLGDPRVGHPAALPGPRRPVVGAAFVRPRGQGLPGRGGQRDGPDLVSLAVQADLSGPSGEDDVLDIETAALWHPGPGVQHHRHDRPVPGAAAGSGPLDLALLGGVSFLSAVFGPGFAVPEDGDPLRG